MTKSKDSVAVDACATTHPAKNNTGIHAGQTESNQQNSLDNLEAVLPSGQRLRQIITRCFLNLRPPRFVGMSGRLWSNKLKREGLHLPKGPLWLLLCFCEWTNVSFVLSFQ